MTTIIIYNNFRKKAIFPIRKSKHSTIISQTISTN